MSQPARNELEGLWTADEVAAFVGLHVQTIYEKARLGEIPSLKIGRVLRFRPSEIQAWVNAQANPSAPAEKVG